MISNLIFSDCLVISNSPLLRCLTTTAFCSPSARKPWISGRSGSTTGWRRPREGRSWGCQGSNSTRRTRELSTSGTLSTRSWSFSVHPLPCRRSEAWILDRGSCCSRFSSENLTRGDQSGSAGGVGKSQSCPWCWSTGLKVSELA